MPRPLPALAAGVCAAVVVVSCAGGRPGTAPPARSTPTVGEACGDVVVEPLDPRSTQHLLPGAPEPSYAADPPTSGPHVSAGVASGTRSEPVPAPVQVAVLEEGGVMVQYRPDLPEADRARLTSLAGDKVVVAPNPGLSDPVVATAWLHRLVCTSVDVATLREFISQREGKGPG